MKKLLKIVDLVCEEKLYPRIKLGWLTAYQYSQAMKSGSEFPAIVVGSFEGKMYVVDGWHRIEAKKLLKEEYIQATVKTYESFKDMFIDAVKLNATHGRPLSVQEKVRIVELLKQYGIEKEQITEIVKIPFDKIERFSERAIVKPNGTVEYLKSVTAKSGVEDAEQDSFNVRSVESLLVQLAELLKSDSFAFAEKVQGLATEVYSLLGEKLKLKVEAV